MKKLCYILAALMLICFFGGCSAAVQGGSSQGSELSQNGTGTLVVYYTEYANYASAATKFRQKYPDITVDGVKFKTAAELEEQLIKELNTNQGPDVVLLDSMSTLDLKKLAQTQAFVALDDFFTSDEAYDENDYLPAAIDACKVDGTQYFVPFTIKPVLAYSAQSVFEKSQIVPAKTSTEAFFAAMQAHADAEGADADVLSFHRARYQVIPGYENSYTGTLLAAWGSGILGEDPLSFAKTESFRKQIEWLKLVYKQEEKRSQISGSIPENQPSLNMYDQMNTETFAHLSTMADLSLSLWQNLNYLRDGVYGEDVACFPLAVFDDSEHYGAVLGWFGAITKDCENLPGAYAFLKIFMDHFDYSAGIGLGYHTPVRKDQFEQNFSFVKNSSSGGGIEFTGLSEAQLQALLEVYLSYNRIYLPNAKIEGLVDTEFLPYYLDSLGFEECLESFQNKLVLYLEE